MALNNRNTPGGFNLDTDYGYEKLRQIEEKQANLSQAEKERENEPSFLSKFNTPDAFEAWKKRKENPYSDFTPYAGEVAKNLNPDVDFNTVNGESVEGPSSPATPSADGGLNWGAGGMEALKQLPSVIDNFSGKPTTSGEAQGNIANNALSGASIGMQVGGPWGAAIGAVALGVGTAVSNSGWYDEVLADNDRAVEKGLDQGKQDRMRDYISNKTSDQLKAEGKAYARALGYSDRTLGLTS